MNSPETKGVIRFSAKLNIIDKYGKIAETVSATYVTMCVAGAFRGIDQRNKTC